MSEHIMENLTIRPLNDVSEKLSKRANEHEIRNGTLSALTERCNRLEAENAKLRELALEILCSCPVSEDDCAKCQHHIGESDEDWCDIPILMEKLGVEVD